MSKDEAAAALAAKRWKKTKKADRVEISKSMNLTRWGNATPEERAAHGRMLTDARAKAAAKRGSTKKGAVKKA